MPVHEAIQAKTKQISNLRNKYNVNKQDDDDVDCEDGVYTCVARPAGRVVIDA